MKSIFDEEAYNDITLRLDELSPDDKPSWGKMGVTQMLKHCQKPIKLAFGEEKVQRPNVFMKLLIRLVKPTLYNDKPWKKGLPTAQEFVIQHTEDFETEKSKLKGLVKRFYDSKSYFEPSKPHPIFGEMKSKMWGQWGYKHLDHHLKQFGV